MVIEAFEIKDLFDLRGHSGLFLFKSRIKGGYLFQRLINPNEKVVVHKIQGITNFNDVVIYTTNKEAPEVSLESVIEHMYELQENDVVFPSNLKNVTANLTETLMESVVPLYDKSQFKPYHMEKILKWFTEINTALDMIDENEKLST